MKSTYLLAVSVIYGSVEGRSDWQSLVGTATNDKDFRFNYFTEFEDDEDLESETLYGTLQLQFREDW